MSVVPDLIVITGPPGAGKSTVARILSQQFDLSALVAGDDFFAMIDQGSLEPWTPESRQQNETVVGAAATAAGRLVIGGYTVVYDGVIGPWFLNAFFDATELSEIHYAVLLPTEQDCVRRVGARVGHGFTDLDATRRMYREFAEATIDDRHVLSTGGSREVAAAAIRERVAARSLVWKPS